MLSIKKKTANLFGKMLSLGIPLCLGGVEILVLYSCHMSSAECLSSSSNPSYLRWDTCK